MKKIIFLLLFLPAMVQAQPEPVEAIAEAVLSLIQDEVIIEDGSISFSKIRQMRTEDSKTYKVEFFVNEVLAGIIWKEYKIDQDSHEKESKKEEFNEIHYSRNPEPIKTFWLEGVLLDEDQKNDIHKRVTDYLAESK